ncbi:hypothetical protein K3495_g6687 [Podosphaera aphanis]|nr:hypothetical protein K3495_g6687 [Podosphaera aphanis]
MLTLTSTSQFNEIKKSPLLIVDFFATWCGPCNTISPIFEKLSANYSSSPQIVFAKCDVDQASDIAQACGIAAMPTFQFYKLGRKVDEIKGADAQQLQTKIGYYATAVVKDAESAAGASHDNSKPRSLGDLIEVDASKLRGASNLSSVRNIVSPPPAGYAIASQTGQAQLLAHLHFKATVTAHEVRITAGKDSMGSAPSRIQVGSNVPVKINSVEGAAEKDDLEMESLSKAENIQEFQIFSDDYVNGIAVLKLKGSKFSGIKSLTIRVDSNMSGEPGTVTKISQMEIFGVKA